MCAHEKNYLQQGRQKKPRAPTKSAVARRAAKKKDGADTKATKKNDGADTKAKAATQANGIYIMWCGWYQVVFYKHIVVGTRLSSRIYYRAYNN